METWHGLGGTVELACSGGQPGTERITVLVSSLQKTHTMKLAPALLTSELTETLWLRFRLRKQSGSRPCLIDKGVVCWPHESGGLLLSKPVRWSGVGREVPAGRTQ